MTNKIVQAFDSFLSESEFFDVTPDVRAILFHAYVAGSVELGNSATTEDYYSSLYSASVALEENGRHI